MYETMIAKRLSQRVMLCDCEVIRIGNGKKTGGREMRSKAGIGSHTYKPQL